MEKLNFQNSPIVTIGSNKFINVPVILKYEDTPLIEIIKEQTLGYTTSIPIYHSDGTYLAKVKGTRIFPTDDGKKAGIQMEHPYKKTICKMGNRTIFEIHHETGDAFKTFAELYTPDGYFIKYDDKPIPTLLDIKGNFLKVGGVTMTGCTFQNLRIGIWIKKDGSCALGCA
jgi:hypothetical protein